MSNELCTNYKTRLCRADIFL